MALSLTPDGVFVLFASTANNLVTKDHNAGFADIFLRNRTNGTVALVSVNASRTSGGNGHSPYASVTPDGRYVVFASDASDLVTNDFNQAGDAFVRDMTTGTTLLVSVNRQGTGSGNGDSSSPTITPDGRYVAFVSAASDLVDGDTNGIPDVFVRDLQTGATTLVSAQARTGYGGSASSSDSPAMTPDGRFVAFTSTASNLVPGSPTLYQEVYVRDLALGQTIWVSTNVTTASPRISYSPVLSDDGRFVAFKTSAADKFLVLRRDLQSAALDVISTNAAGFEPPWGDVYGPEMSSDGRHVAFSGASTTANTSSIWLWDGQTKTTFLVSANLLGQPSADGLCDAPALTPDGRFVAFVSSGTDLVTNEVNGEFQVYVRDMQSGVTKLVTPDSNGVAFGNAEGAVPVLTPDGRFVLFDSRSDAFVGDDQNDAYDVFVRDTAAETTELVSRRQPGAPANTGNSFSSISGNAVSADGRYVVFESWASDLVPGDTNDFQDAFIHDVQTGTNGLVSVNALGSGSANGPSLNPSISANGRYVVFTSTAENLVANDTNKLEDVFVRDLAAGTTLLVAVGTSGASADRASSSPSISADGRWVAFQSAPRRSAFNNIFVCDLATSTTTLVSTNFPSDIGNTRSCITPIISPDGRFVAFQRTSTAPGTTVIVKDLQTGFITAMGTNATSVAFSGNSRFFAAVCGVGVTELVGIAVTTNKQLLVTDLLQRTNTALVLGPGASSNRSGPSLSADGRFAAFSFAAASSPGALAGADMNNAEDIFVYEVPTGNLTLVSANQTGTATGNGRSYWPQISADGRHVAFRSAASDLTPGDTNGSDDIFLFDRVTGQTTLLSHRLDSLAAANAMSLGLAMATEAKLVVFNSAASDLVNGDYNETVDVFAIGFEQTVLLDSDQDGLDDSWELAYFSNLPHNGSADSDGDGLTDAAEYRAGTNPTDPALALNLAGVALAAGQTRISWTAAPGRSYRAQYKDALNEPNWHDLPGPVTVVGSTAWISDAAPAGVPQRFYRLVVAE
ncbi:MAG: hypothetical protein AAB676_19675 [Verrucomicrobiota bacterium]